MHKNNNEDTIVLSFKNALIMGHCPESVKLEQVANKRIAEPMEVGKFGLFDSSAPNYTQYYPDVKAEDLVPKDGDFFMPLVRALSEVVVHKGYNPVDFSRPGVLKNAMDLLYGQTVYVDHETATGNAIGTIAELAWEDAYTSKGGQQVPAGVNARLKIDGKSNPRLVRLMAMDPPGIHSVSVTVRFNWEKSHPYLSDEEFMAKLGTFDKDGNMYRRIANSINSFHEISLVGHGADPFAQIIKDGEINNPRYANIVYNKADGTKALKFAQFDFRLDTIANSQNPTIPVISNNINTETPKDMKELLILLAASLSVDTTNKEDSALALELQPKLTDFLATAQNSKDKVTNLEAKITQLESDLAEAKKVAAGLDTAKLAMFDSYMENLRQETIKFHTLVNKGTPEEAVKNLVAKTDLNTLQVLKAQYEKQANELVPLQCAKCHSKEITRASATLTNPLTDKKEIDKNKEVRNKTITSMHG